MLIIPGRLVYALLCKKVISKIITIHLKTVMGKIIYSLQGAFVPNQLIQDNILIAHEILHSFRKNLVKVAGLLLNWI